MKLALATFAGLADPCAVTIHSLDQALYQATVCHNGVEKLLLDETGRTLRRHSLQAMREALQGMPVSSLVLRQQSAYDEMVGQPRRETDNALVVPLSLELYPPISQPGK